MTNSLPFVVSPMSDEEASALYEARFGEPADERFFIEREMTREEARNEVLTDEDRAAILKGVARMVGGFAYWRLVIVPPYDDPVDPVNTHGGRAEIYLRSDPEEDVDPVFVVARIGCGKKFYIAGLRSSPDECFDSAEDAMKWLQFAVIFDKEARAKMSVDARRREAAFRATLSA